MSNTINNVTDIEINIKGVKCHNVYNEQTINIDGKTLYLIK